MEELRFHPEQHRLWTSNARFRIVPSGRRSGKSELAKRYLIKSALIGTDYPSPNFFAGAPSRTQAKRIYWKDIKEYAPKDTVEKISETELTVQFCNGSTIHVIGMDRPERVEGTPWDGGILDEYANMKPTAWPENVRPALSDREGWCWLIGVPEGRNHYYDLYRKAKQYLAENENNVEYKEWDIFHWFSEDILPEKEILAAKHNLDEQTYDQEYKGCHYPDTRVLMADYSEKEISQLTPGDKILYLDLGKHKVCEVLHQGSTGIKETQQVLLETGETFKASKYHKLKVDNQTQFLNDTEYIEKTPLFWRPSNLIEAKAALVGFNTGDGNITEKGNSIQGIFSSKYKEDVDAIGRDIYKAFGNKVPITKEKKGKVLTHHVYCTADEARELVKAGCPAGSKVFTYFEVPEWIRNSNNFNVKRAYLAGLFGAEATTPVGRNKDSKRPREIVFSMSKLKNIDFSIFFDQLNSILFQAGITTTTAIRESKNNRQIYSITISDIDSIYNYLTKIGFLYAYNKQLVSWLWVNYIKKYRFEAAYSRLKIAEYRENGLNWADIGARLNKPSSTVKAFYTRKADSPQPFRDFPSFKKWLAKRWVSSANLLKVRIKDRIQLQKIETYNISVSSPDSSYILADGINNYNSFVSHYGKAYYNFNEEIHAQRLTYNREGDLHIAFDFNVSPGVAAIIQHFNYDGRVVDGVVDEIYIQRNSNTKKITNKIIERYQNHAGNVFLYGDATGGGGHTSSDKSDWTIIEDMLTKYFDTRLYKEVPHSNPKVRDRVNAMNSRLKNIAGEYNFFVDPVNAPETLKDFEGTSIVESGTGEIDKRDLKYSHMTDAIGYYVYRKYPIKRNYGGMARLGGF